MNNEDDTCKECGFNRAAHQMCQACRFDVKTHRVITQSCPLFKDTYEEVELARQQG